MTKFIARYTTTAVYLGCVGLVMLMMVFGSVTLVPGLLAIAALILVVTVLAEVQAVHALVNGQRDALVKEIERLKTLLDTEEGQDHE